MVDLARLVENLRRDRDLAKIMEEPAYLDPGYLLWRKSQFLGQSTGQLGHPSLVPGGIGVSGFYSGGQGADGAIQGSMQLFQATFKRLLGLPPRRDISDGPGEGLWGCRPDLNSRRRSTLPGTGCRPFLKRYTRYF